ncbi:MAG: hypothetical protein JWP01_784 [Myxococcales bacterium]|nr:hypothetical protein [Myxococcales bacterium]
MGRPKVVIDLAEDDATRARDLAAGGLFVDHDVITSAGCDLAFNAECELVVRGTRGELSVPARVVFVDPAKGAGLEIVGFGPAIKEQLAQLVQVPPAAEGADARTAEDAGDAGDAGDADDADDAADAADAGGADAEQKKKFALNIHERLRGMTLADQIKTASSSDPTTRMTLERLYGKNVWEALLRNPRLTAPEVARLARMGTMPRILMETIVSNGAWLQIAEVRRALLSNPRLGVDQIVRVLRMLTKNELKVASTLMAYPHAVRDAAKRILKTT